MLQQKIDATETADEYKPHQGLPPLDNQAQPLSFFELWPRWAFYPPVALYALWLSAKYGGLTTLTASNPSMKNGGFVGDSKNEVYHLFPDSLKEYIPLTLFIKAKTSIEQVTEEMGCNGLAFPIVAKPDSGCRGAGVQKICDIKELDHYLSNFPETDNVILQEYVPYEAEAGVFYIRHPNEEKGHIFSLTLKYFPYIYGDGKSTIKQLIVSDKRASKLQETYLTRHQDKLDVILSKDEPFRLSFAGAHSKGTIFKNGNAYITPAIEEFFDRLSKKIPEFYFGRFDIRFKDMTSLETGKNMKIIELNGAGAEATHIWDSKTSLLEAYGTLFKQFKHVYEIGAKNKERGFKAQSTKELWKHICDHESNTAQYPPTH